MEGILPQAEGEKLEKYKNVFNNFRELLEVNPSIRFACFGVGNITGKSGGDNQGRHGFYWDINRRSFVFTNALDFLDRDVLGETGELLKMWEKTPTYFIDVRKVVSGFCMNVLGEKHSPYFADTRTGNRFFAGTVGERNESLYNHQQLQTLVEMLNIQKTDPGDFIQMMEALCERYIPYYYQELERIKKEQLRGNLD